MTPAPITIRYASTRADIWRAYWRAWVRGRGLWRFHVLFALTGGAVLALGAPQPTPAGFVLRCVGVFALCLLVFPLVPQARFKSAEREFTIDASGWTTVIGTLSGSRRWNEVRAVVDAGDVIEIASLNGNVVVVPRRAFADAQARADFVQAATAWHAAARG